MTDIDYFWDPSTQLWIVFAVDADGYQLWDAMYFPNRHAIAATFHL